MSEPAHESLNHDNTFKHLLDALQRRYPDLEETAVSSLEDRNDAFIEKIIQIIRQDGNPETRSFAIKALHGISSLGWLKTLIDVAQDDEDKSVRLVAIRHLGHSGQKMAIPTLEKIVARDADSDIIREASVAIQVLQGITPEGSQDLDP